MSNLPFFSKLLERVVQNRLQFFLVSSDLMPRSVSVSPVSQHRDCGDKSLQRHVACCWWWAVDRPVSTGLDGGLQHHRPWYAIASPSAREFTPSHFSDVVHVSKADCSVLSTAVSCRRRIIWFARYHMIGPSSKSVTLFVLYKADPAELCRGIMWAEYPLVRW